MTYSFRKFPDKLLNKWIGEDVQDEEGKPPVYTVSYFLKNSIGGISSFWFLEYETPPLMGFTPNVKPYAAMEDPIIFKTTDEHHPLRFVNVQQLNRAMMKSIFDRMDVEVK